MIVAAEQASLRTSEVFVGIAVAHRLIQSGEESGKPTARDRLPVSLLNIP